MSNRSFVLLTIASAFSLVMSPHFTSIVTDPTVRTCERASNDTLPTLPAADRPEHPPDNTTACLSSGAVCKSLMDAAANGVLD